MDILNAKGKALRLSASAAETWLDCKRKWAYSYYWRIPRVSSPAADIGNHVHDVLENYLKTGEKPEDPNNRYWRIAEPGLPFLPEVDDTGVTGNWQVEEWVKCDCGPLPFVGKVDLYNLTDFENIQVDDHKTTGDGSWRWAKSPRQLAKLLQPHAYAWSLVQVHGLTPPESVDFRHIYYCTKGEPKAMEVRAPNVPWTDIEDTWKKLEIIAGQMATTAVNLVEPEDVEATTTSCKKFGGCPYADRCSASPVNRDKVTEIKALNIERDEEMSDKLTALRAQLGLSTVSETPTQKTEAKPVRTHVAQPVEDPQGNVTELANQLLRAIKGGNVIPIAAAEAMARSADVYLFESMKIANLHNVNGFLVPKELSMVEADKVTAEARKASSNDTNDDDVTGEGTVLARWLQYLQNNDSRMSRKDAQAIVRDATGAQRVRKERILEYIKQFNEEYSDMVLTLQGNVLCVVNQDNYTTTNPAKDLGEATLDKPASSKSDALGGHLSDVVSSWSDFSTKDLGAAQASGELRDEVTPKAAVSKSFVPEPEETPLGRIVKEVDTPTIYIDCIPEDPAGVYSFTDFVREYEMEVEKEGGKVNDKFTQPLPYYGVLDYGQGPKRVAGKVLAALHRSGPQIFKGDMFVDGKHPLADEIIPILRRLKGVRVVRASR